MSRILLIRHGSTDPMREQLCGRMPGISLNAEGRRQAKVLAERLKTDGNVTAVYSGPLERARETAEIIGGRQSLSVHVDDRLNELEFGAWTGLTFAELQGRQEWQEYNHNRSRIHAPGGESLIAVQGRAWDLVSELSRHHPNGTVAVITHGDVIRALIVHLLGMSLDHLLRFEIAPASMTDVSIGKGEPLIHSLNTVVYHAES